MKLYLIRHGETDWNLQGRLQGREDIELNETGILQAKLCGQAFRDKHIKAVVTSPLKRASRTAEIIRDTILAETLIVEEGLIERDFGKLSGQTFDKKKHFDTFGIDEGIEPWEKLCTRLMGCLKKYGEAFDGEDIILISHGAAINAVLAVLSNGEFGSGKTRLKNTCINIISFKEGILKLEHYNLTAEEFRNLKV